MTEVATQEELRATYRARTYVEAGVRERARRAATVTGDPDVPDSWEVEGKE